MRVRGAKLRSISGNRKTHWRTMSNREIAVVSILVGVAAGGIAALTVPFPDPLEATIFSVPFFAVTAAIVLGAWRAGYVLSATYGAAAFLAWCVLFELGQHEYIVWRFRQEDYLSLVIFLPLVLANLAYEAGERRCRACTARFAREWNEAHPDGPKI